MMKRIDLQSKNYSRILILLTILMIKDSFVPIIFWMDELELKLIHMILKWETGFKNCMNNTSKIHKTEDKFMNSQAGE